MEDEFLFNKKIILILTIIFVSLLAVSAVSAADNSTSDVVSAEEINEEIASDVIASEDTADITTDKEVISSLDDANEINSKLYDDALTIEEDNENTLNVDENDANAVITKEVTKEEPVLTSQITNKEILSDYDDDLYTLKLTFIKQTGKYTNNKKVYFKVTWADFDMGADDVQIRYVVYKSNGAKEKVGYATTNANGIGCIKFADGKAHIGTFKIKAELYYWDTSFYGKTVYTDPATIKNVKIYKSRYKVSAPAIKKKYRKSALFKVTVKDKATGKRLKGIKVIMKVYTGKKYKKIVHKTNKKGKTGFNTKHLSKGKHKVVIIIKANSKYKKIVKRTSITIKKPKSNKNKNKKRSSTNSNTYHPGMNDVGSGNHVYTREEALYQSTHNPTPTPTTYTPPGYTPPAYQTNPYV